MSFFEFLSEQTRGGGRGRERRKHSFWRKAAFISPVPVRLPFATTSTRVSMILAVDLVYPVDD